MTASYKISNLDVSAYLLARGVPLARLEPDADGKRCWMIFNIDEHQLASMESAFMQGGQVSAVALLNALRQLRRAMDNALGRNNGNR